MSGSDEYRTGRASFARDVIDRVRVYADRHLITADQCDAEALVAITEMVTRLFLDLTVMCARALGDEPFADGVEVRAMAAHERITELLCDD